MKVKIKKEIEVEIMTLHIRANVRYWEDTTINGIVDIDGKLIPCRDEDNWHPVIEIETGKIINWESGKIADIHYKVCDDGQYWIINSKEEEVLLLDGYVPKTMCPGGNGYGDYIIMKIDSEGFIQNWKFNIDDFKNDEF